MGNDHDQESQQEPAHIEGVADGPTVTITVDAPRFARFLRNNPDYDPGVLWQGRGRLEGFTDAGQIVGNPPDMSFSVRCVVEKDGERKIVTATKEAFDAKTDAMTFPSELYEGEGFTLIAMEGEPDFADAYSQLQR